MATDFAGIGNCLRCGSHTLLTEQPRIGWTCANCGKYWGPSPEEFGRQLADDMAKSMSDAFTEAAREAKEISDIKDVEAQITETEARIATLQDRLRGLNALLLWRKA